VADKRCSSSSDIWRGPKFTTHVSYAEICYRISDLTIFLEGAEGSENGILDLKMACQESKWNRRTEILGIKFGRGIFRRADPSGLTV
jgi:hypothetical protein